MKPKINKTITTKGGGNIIIPNKIISKEYPDNTPQPSPEPQTEDVLLKVFKDANIEVPDLINYDKELNIYRLYYKSDYNHSRDVKIIYSLYYDTTTDISYPRFCFVITNAQYLSYSTTEIDGISYYKPEA